MHYTMDQVRMRNVVNNLKTDEKIVKQTKNNEKKAERTTNGRPFNEILKEKIWTRIVHNDLLFHLCIAQTLVNELREFSRYVVWEEMELELCTKC